MMKDLALVFYATGKPNANGDLNYFEYVQLPSKTKERLNCNN